MLFVCLILLIKASYQQSGLQVVEIHLVLCHSSIMIIVAILYDEFKVVLKFQVIYASSLFLRLFSSAEFFTTINEEITDFSHRFVKIYRIANFCQLLANFLACSVLSLMLPANQLKTPFFWPQAFGSLHIDGARYLITVGAVCSFR